MPTTTSRGYQLNYVVEGDGPPLVLIPGLTQSIQSWVGRGYVERFSRLFRVIALDPLGHGRSDKPHTASAYHMARCALDVLAVLDAEGVREAHIWGYSRGARIANTVATLYSDRVTSLIIGGQLAATVDPRIQAISDDRTRKLAAAFRRGDVDTAMLMLDANDPATREILLGDNDIEALAAALEGDLGGKPDLDFSGLRRPPLAYAGDGEMFLALLRHTATQAGAEFHVIPDANHLSAFASMKKVAPIVEEYLQRSTATRHPAP
jgi:pimeloyl-ACP methyl ester carboxylesterase